MRRFRNIATPGLGLLLLVMAFSGCVPPGSVARRDGPGYAAPGREPAPGRTVIGVLQTSGDDVYVNDVRAVTGMEIRVGDKLKTGAGSAAKVNLPDGGNIVLRESTDPSIREIFTEGWCLVVEFFYGKGHVENRTECINVITPDFNAVVHSSVEVEVSPGSSRITVLDGNVTVKNLKTLGSIRLTRGQFADVRKFRLVDKVITLRPEELSRVGRWKNNYVFRPIAPMRPIPRPGSSVQPETSPLRPGIVSRPPMEERDSRLAAPPATTDRMTRATGPLAPFSPEGSREAPRAARVPTGGSVYRTGSLVIHRNEAVDVDAGRIGEIDAADLLFELRGGRQFWTPRNGAAIGRAAFRKERPEHADCTQVKLSTARIPADEIGAGSTICLRTRSGRLAAINVAIPERPDRSGTRIEYIVWQRR